jgi:hypothetical protein
MYEYDLSPERGLHFRTTHAVAKNRLCKQKHGEGAPSVHCTGTRSCHTATATPFVMTRTNPASQVNYSMSRLVSRLFSSRLVSVQHLHHISPCATPPTPPWSSSTTPRRYAPSSNPVPNPPHPAPSRLLADGASVGVGIEGKGKHGA